MTLQVPNEILNDTPADAIPVDTNYKSIQQYVNTNLVNRDGTVKMTGQLTLVGDPVQDNHAVRKAYVDAVLPVGIMLPWLGVAAPAGQWALANGAVLQTTTYADLFNVLGHRYGGEGGSFNLPNMGGVVPVAVKVDDPRYGTLGNYGGSSKVPVPSHTHGMDHNHPSATTANETQNHQHSIAHTHAAGGAHNHNGRIAALADPGTGRSMFTDPTGPNTAGQITVTDGAHTHAFTGNSGNQIAKHNHGFDVPNFVGSTKAYVLEITDPDSNKSSTDFYAPFVVINYIVRIA